MAKFCDNCGNEIDDKAYVCPKCGILVKNETERISKTNINDRGGVIWWLLGCFFPVVGLILYLVLKNEKPKTAKTVGNGALVSIIIGISLYIIAMLLLGIFFTGLTIGM